MPLDPYVTSKLHKYPIGQNLVDHVEYSVSVVKFGSNGEPTEPSSSASALTPIFSNTNATTCSNNCFHPPGPAWGRNSRLYLTSDTTGEI